MANIIDPLEIGALLAALCVPLVWYSVHSEVRRVRSARALRIENPALHLAKVQQHKRTRVQTLIFLATCGALIWGFVELQNSLTAPPWIMLAAAVTWKVYVFLSFPILCWIFASVVVKAFSSPSK
jgi:hypothetical protein